MVEIIQNLLIIISGICWSVVYVQCARLGFRQKTYCMPLFALGLNFAWEGIYAVTDIFIRRSLGVQAIANAAWFVLDIFILITWFRYGRKEFAGKEKLFLPWTALVIAACFALQFLFISEFGSVEGEKYSAFLQNIAMSLCFLALLEKRKSSEGQSMAIAACKCIGTLTPTILGAMENNRFILATGSLCFIFDAIYIWYLNSIIERERCKA